ncbi:MAG: hypothetical protein ACRD99_02980 [Nitrososphaera sp.]
MPARTPGKDEGEKQREFEASSDTRRDDKSAGILGRLKSRKKKEQVDSDDLPAGGWTVNDLMNEMQMLGLEPSGLGRFIVSLHKLAVSSGVDPSLLAGIIRDLSLLSEGKHVSIDQLRGKIQRLADERKDLIKQVSDLQEKKGALEAELGEKKNEHREGKESLSEFLHLRTQLKANGIALDDLSRLSSMIASAKQAGYDSSSIISLLSDIKSAKEKKITAATELDQLLDSKRIAQQRALALEQEIAEKQKILDSADTLARLGFGTKELDDLGAAIRMISKTRNIDEVSAKDRLIADLQSYYANDQELRSRLRTLESLLREKEDKFTMLESDFQNEKAVLDNANKLISAGLDEKWLMKLRSIIDSYGIDIDALARELQTRKDLSTSIEGLVKTKKALEEEERLLRQKVVAAEDQRIKTLSLINDLIVNAPRAAGPQQKHLDDIKRVAVSGDNSEFLISAQKAIEIIRAKLPSGSPAKLVLEHALLALRLEPTRKDQDDNYS